MSVSKTGLVLGAGLVIRPLVNHLLGHGYKTLIERVVSILPTVPPPTLATSAIRHKKHFFSTSSTDGNLSVPEESKNSFDDKFSRLPHTSHKDAPSQNEYYNPGLVFKHPPFTDIRVLDFSRLLPGPYCTQLLTDLGAEVIKVEDPAGGDGIRAYPPACPDGNSALFHALNRGKKSILANLKNETDRERVLALLPDVDVVVEGFRPGVMKRLGLAPQELVKRFPHLIVCSITGYGQTGVKASIPGHDLNYMSNSGVLGMMREPAPLPVQVADMAGGAWPAAFQIAAALYRRGKQRTNGGGCVIDVSMTEGAQSMLVMSLARHAVDGEPVGKGRDFLVGGTPCYDVYRAKDGGYITVGALEERFWTSMIRIMGLEKEIGEGAFACEAEGIHVQDVLRRAFRTRTSEEWERIFAPHVNEVMVSVVKDPESAPVRTVPVCIDGKTFDFVRTPLNMRGATCATKRGPALGEHTDEVFSRL